MTRFARAAGSAGPWRLSWELKAVNAKGLDARLRLSPPFDAIEPDARARIAQKLARGTIQAAFTAQRETTTPEVRVNQDLLRKLMTAIAAIPLPEMISPATLDGLLSVRGVVDIRMRPRTRPKFSRRGRAPSHSSTRRSTPSSPYGQARAPRLQPSSRRGLRRLPR